MSNEGIKGATSSPFVDLQVLIGGWSLFLYLVSSSTSCLFKRFRSNSFVCRPIDSKRSLDSHLGFAKPMRVLEMKPQNSAQRCVNPCVLIWFMTIWTRGGSYSKIYFSIGWFFNGRTLSGSSAGTWCRPTSTNSPPASLWSTASESSSRECYKLSWRSVCCDWRVMEKTCLPVCWTIILNNVKSFPCLNISIHGEF